MAQAHLLMMEVQVGPLDVAEELGGGEGEGES